jgi:TusA-related sulfurtransferase
VNDPTAQFGASLPDRRSDAPNASESTDAAAVVVDARGLICPAPVIALAKAARALPEGSRVTVLATDPAAAVDVPAWARMRGHQVVETTEDGEHLVLTVLLGPAKAR